MRYWRYYPPFSLFFSLKSWGKDMMFKYTYWNTMRHLRQLEAQVRREGEILAQAVKDQAEKLAEEMEPEVRRRAIRRRQLRHRGEHDN
jgi:hypothetical protein